MWYNFGNVSTEELTFKSSKLDHTVIRFLLSPQEPAMLRQIAGRGRCHRHCSGQKAAELRLSLFLGRDSKHAVSRCLHQRGHASPSSSADPSGPSGPQRRTGCPRSLDPRRYRHRCVFIRTSSQEGGIWRRRRHVPARTMAFRQPREDEPNEEFNVYLWPRKVQLHG